MFKCQLCSKNEAVLQCPDCDRVVCGECSDQGLCRICVADSASLPAGRTRTLNKQRAAPPVVAFKITAKGRLRTKIWLVIICVLAIGLAAYARTARIPAIETVNYTGATVNYPNRSAPPNQYQPYDNRTPVAYPSGADSIPNSTAPSVQAQQVQPPTPSAPSYTPPAQSAQNQLASTCVPMQYQEFRHPDQSTQYSQGNLILQQDAARRQQREFEELQRRQRFANLEQERKLQKLKSQQDAAIREQKQQAEKIASWQKKVAAAQNDVAKAQSDVFRYERYGKNWENSAKLARDRLERAQKALAEAMRRQPF